MQATPTTWKMLIESGWAGSPRLKILCGGEPLKPALAEQLCHRAARLWNFYGPTETTVWSTAAEVRPAGELTIGGPLANTRVYILRDACELAPVGSAGELCIAGAGVARGYLNAPDLTRERFVPDPFASPGSRMYRTGDLARWLPDGQIECLGRLDRQVKIRGYRVETAEIEVVLKQHHGIADALVTASENGFGDNRLVGYVISQNGPPSFTELRDFARTRLPHYMVPAHFVLLREFPVTPNGKLDLRRLPPPEQVAIPTRSRVSPRNQREQRIADIWREVLGVKDLGVDDNFFELGGDSLSATRVFARVAAQFSTEISLRDLFEHPTIGQLAGMLSDESPVHAALSRIPRLPR